MVSDSRGRKAQRPVMKKPKKKRGARGPAKGEGGRPRGPETERINWRLRSGTVAGIERLAKADGLTGPEYLESLAGVKNAKDQPTNPAA